MTENAAWQDVLITATPTVFGEFSTVVLSGQGNSSTPPEMSQIAADLLHVAQRADMPNAM